MKYENYIYKVDIVDKVDIGIFIATKMLLYINIIMSTLDGYIYINRWT
jgi:hypothetical protein